MELSLKEIEITKLDLQPGQVLAVKVFADDISSRDLAQLKQQIQTFFPNNRIMLFAMPVDGRIEMDVIDTRPLNLIVNPPAVNITSPCAEPASYCNDCGCGKKERIEGIKK